MRKYLWNLGTAVSLHHFLRWYQSAMSLKSVLHILLLIYLIVQTFTAIYFSVGNYFCLPLKGWPRASETVATFILFRTARKGANTKIKGSFNLRFNARKKAVVIISWGHICCRYCACNQRMKLGSNHHMLIIQLSLEVNYRLIISLVHHLVP